MQQARLEVQPVSMAANPSGPAPFSSTRRANREQRPRPRGQLLLNGKQTPSVPTVLLTDRRFRFRSESFRGQTQAAHPLDSERGFVIVQPTEHDVVLRGLVNAHRVKNLPNALGLAGSNHERG